MAESLLRSPDATFASTTHRTAAWHQPTATTRQADLSAASGGGYRSHRRLQAETIERDSSYYRDAQGVVIVYDEPALNGTERTACCC